VIVLPNVAQGARRPLVASIRFLTLALLSGTAMHPTLACAGTVPDAPAAAPRTTDTENDGITVTGTRAPPETVSTGALGSRSVFETPFSVAQVDADDIQRNAATTIDAAFAYDAGVRSNNSGVASGNTFSVRGIGIDRTNGYKLDGLAFPYWFQDHPIEHLGELQILKGAGGFAYGFAAPGGVVNMASKRPTRDFQAVANISYRSSSILREHVDLGGPLNRDGTIGFRFNAANEQGTLYNGAYNKDQFLSLALDFRISDRLSASLDGFYQRTRQDNQVNTISIKQGVTSLATVSGDLQPGAPGSTKFNDVDSITGRLNYQISHDWKASIAARYAALDERFPGSTVTVTNNAGDYTETAFNMNRLFRYYVGDASIEGKFDTGPIHHLITGGLSSITVQFDYDNPTPYTLTTTANIYNPNSVPSILGNASALTANRPPNYQRYQEIHQKAAYASDTLSWGPVSVLLGLRYTDYEEINYPYATTATTTTAPYYTTTATSGASYFHYRPVSPVYSASLDITHGLRAYVTYVEALQRGGLAPVTASNPNASYGPLTTTQYEAGLKSQGRWGSASIAVYRIATPSEYTNAANIFVRDGTARYQGIEGNVTLTPVKGLSLSGSAALLDAKQISGNAAIVGKNVPGTTRFQISGQAEYAPPFAPGVKINGGLRHSGRSYGFSDNSFIYGASTVGDLGASYALSAKGHDVLLRANVLNVADQRYWVPGATGTTISPGAPRTFSLSAQVALNGTHSEDGPPTAIAKGDKGLLHTGAYISIEGGLAAPLGFNATTVNKTTNTGAAPVANGLYVNQKAGWDLDAALGYSIGRLRGEVEAGYKRYNIGAIAYNNASVPLLLQRDVATPVAGLYGNAGGRTGVLSFLANGLVDLGAREARFGAFVGGGLGLARVASGHWALDKATSVAFSNDLQTAFAWQGLAGLRYALNRRTDVTIKYKYFVVPNLHLRTANGNEIDGNLKSHSLLAGLTFHL
jgi:iron complex outermembrane receptor protein